jgi:cytochrome b561
MIEVLGTITYLLLFFTVLLQVLKVKKKIKFSFKAHKVMAYSTLILATIHALVVELTSL